MSITVHTTHFNARPDCGDRLEKEAHVYELLDRLGISYEGVDHDTANTIEDCEAVEQELGVKICKNLFLRNRQKTTFYLLLMPGRQKIRDKGSLRATGNLRLFLRGTGIYGTVFESYTGVRKCFGADE